MYKSHYGNNCLHYLYERIKKSKNKLEEQAQWFKILKYICAHGGERLKNMPNLHGQVRITSAQRISKACTTCFHSTIGAQRVSGRALRRCHEESIRAATPCRDVKIMSVIVLMRRIRIVSRSYICVQSLYEIAMQHFID